MQTRIFGIFEVNESGTVLYSRLHEIGLSANNSESIVGRNFFEEFADFENCKDFRQRFRNFLQSRQSVDNFHFDYLIEMETIAAEISMTRGHESGDNRSLDFVILDIRKTSSNGALMWR